MMQEQGPVVAYGVAAKQRPPVGMVADWSAVGGTLCEQEPAAWHTLDEQRPPTRRVCGPT
jgi:hypothetical protein